MSAGREPLPPDESWEVEIEGARVAFGAGALIRLGDLARGLGIGRALLVTDPGLVGAGHAARAERALRDAGVEVLTFEGVAENPDTGHVQRGAQCALEHDADGLVALGGGSAMDCAKGINFIHTNGGRMEDYLGFGKADRPMLPSIGVPTTAGTGSEAQSYALISREQTHVKMACGDRKARFRAVVLDPELPASAPREVGAVAGIDAISHAVESHVTRCGNPISSLFAREAWRLLEGSFETALLRRGDLAAGGRMLLGAYLAGQAIEHSMLGAAHACANPLTARFGVSHGIAVGLMLPAVVRFNAVAVGARYEELRPGADGEQPGAALERRIRELWETAGFPARLRDYGVSRECLPELAGEAVRQWTAGHNPRRVGEYELLELYEASF